MKPCYPSLLTPGIHDMDLQGAHELCCEQFASATTRRHIWSRFLVFLKLLMETRGEFEVWVDGSFTTQKPDPGDVDVVVFFDPVWLQGQPPPFTMAFERFAKAIKENQIRYSTDARFCPSNDMNMRSYWRGWYGFDREETPKGIIRLTISSGPSGDGAPVTVEANRGAQV